MLYLCSDLKLLSYTQNKVLYSDYNLISTSYAKNTILHSSQGRGYCVVHSTPYYTEITILYSEFYVHLTSCPIKTMFTMTLLPLPEVPCYTHRPIKYS